jgi:hypothetical protein
LNTAPNTTSGPALAEYTRNAYISLQGAAVNIVCGGIVVVVVVVAKQAELKFVNDKGARNELYILLF